MGDGGVVFAESDNFEDMMKWIESSRASSTRPWPCHRLRSPMTNDEEMNDIKY